MLPSASTTLNTARVEPSGDRPRYAVPTAPRLRAPGSSCVGRRGVRLPANTPPACKFGAPASGAPSGSRIVDVPIPCKPLGALAGQRRPKALLIEIPSGLLTPVKPADAAVLQLCRSGLPMVSLKILLPPRPWQSFVLYVRPARPLRLLALKGVHLRSGSVFLADCDTFFDLLDSLVDQPNGLGSVTAFVT
jgi:hypothetical protein